MVDENSDILGGGPIPLRPLHSSPWYKNPSKVGPILVLFVAGYILFRQASLRFAKWQEKSYKLATRRRYGIPDNDRRPFNVAYAAVNRERQARSTASRSTPDPQSASQPQTSGRNDAQTRQRFNSTGPNAIPSWAAPQTTGHQSGSPYRSSQVFPTEPNSQAAQSTQQNRTHRSGRRTLDLSRPTNNERKKRAFDDGDHPDSDHAKKTRVEGEELIDGDEDAGWQEDGATHRNERGSKRLYVDEELSENDVEPSKRIRDKRARKISREHTPEDQVMAEDDEVAELKAFSRGKKRDRGEAGSSFGGDDDERVDDEGYESSKLNQSRKRRTVHKRKSEAHVRGSKRDRNADSYESDGADDDRMKGRIRRDRSVGDSSDDALISKDLLCKGRRIGEEWDLNGVQYKVGPNGDRLRQALIKKARSKFNMPKDSEHPDRAANMEVYVETWLTEEQYNDAREHQQLAWQGSGSTSAEPDSSQSPPESPKKVGKDLLWTSAVPGDSVPRRRNASRQSIATNVVFRSNPFENPLPSPSRRVASAYAGPPPDILSISMSSSTGSGASSPRPVHRSFSKWEKQDLEAEAIRKMRSKAQEQKKISEEEKKKAEAALTPTPTPAPSFAPPALATTISFANSKTTEVPAVSNPAKARANTPSLIVPIAVKESTQPACPPASTGAATPSFSLPVSTTAQLQPGGNMFANGVSAKASTASSPLVAPPINAATTPAAPSLAPKPFLGFGASNASTPTSSAPPPPAATAFPFGNNTAANKPAGAQNLFQFPTQSAQRKEELALPRSTPSSESNSLLARLGQAPAASAPTFLGNSHSPTAVNASGEPSKPSVPSFPFGQNQTNLSTTPASAPAAAPLKFSFGNPAAVAAPIPSPSTTVPAFGTPASISEVARSPFGLPSKPAETPAGNFFTGTKPAGVPDKPLFPFGKVAAPAIANSTTALPSANGGVFSFGSRAGNPFSSAAGAPPAEGFESAGGVFGGAVSTTPTTATGGAVANGARIPSGVPPTLFPKAAEGSPTPFSFGTTSTPSPAATAKAPMTFKFGSTVSPSSPSPFGVPAAVNGSTTSGFFGQNGTAATTTPAAFGFGAGSGFSFGSAPPTPGEQK